MNIESLSNTAKAELLARIAFMLIVCARDTYEVGTENVLEPQVLRAYNELLHRVTAAVSDHLSGVEGFSLQTILEMMRAFGQRHNRVNGMNWAIEHSVQEPLD
jgi:hypothetical protein